MINPRTFTMQKILITGSTGFLGSRLAYYYKDKYELLLPSRSQLNVSREEAVREYLEEHRPDIVLHCAALSSTDYCELHPEESHKVNVQGTVKLAKACKLFGAKLIFMSSEQVYNGVTQRGPLKEYDALQPNGIYGSHKLEAEQRALRNNSDSVGLRLTWMYDLPDSPFRHNINVLANIQKAYDEGSTLRASTHLFHGVTNVWEVVRNMEKAFALPGGIYNFGSCPSAGDDAYHSEGVMNSYELHLQAAALMGLKDASQWILPDEEGLKDLNFAMDCGLLGDYGIHFCESIEGIEKAITMPFRY